MFNLYFDWTWRLPAKSTAFNLYFPGVLIYQPCDALAIFTTSSITGTSFSTPTGMFTLATSRLATA
jgi:hypothetical protein